MTSSFSMYCSTSEPGLSTSLRMDISYSTIWMLSLQLALCLKISISSSSNIYSINFSWSSPSCSWLSLYFFWRWGSVGTPCPRGTRSTRPLVILAVAAGALRPFAPETEALFTRPRFGYLVLDPGPVILLEVILIALWLDLWLTKPGLWSFD